eukprot:1500730-Alexandrium_andersonii.AAC.1
MAHPPWWWSKGRRPTTRTRWPTACSTRTTGATGPCGRTARTTRGWSHRTMTWVARTAPQTSRGLRGRRWPASCLGGRSPPTSCRSSPR